MNGIDVFFLFETSFYENKNMYLLFDYGVYWSQRMRILKQIHSPRKTTSQEMPLC